MSSRIQRYKQAKADRLAGKYNGAPFYHSFPRLGNIVPAIPKAMQIMTLAGSGVGKSQSVIGLGVMTVYSLIKSHNYKAKMYIFLLEDPKELFEDRLFCRIMFSKFSIDIDPMELNSVREEVVSNDIEAKFEEVDAIVEDILKYCVLVDNIYNATGIYKYLRTEAGELGEHVWEERIFTYKKKDGSTFKEPKNVYKEYIPNDPDLHVIVFVDNLNNLAEEFDSKLNKPLNVREAMGKWSRDYGRLQITKHWKWTVWNIVQTALDTDKKQFDMRGTSIVEKLEPNLSSLGDNKIISRDHHLILALFSPARFGIEDYMGYNTEKLRDAFRALIVLKSNFSVSNIKVPLYFNGACSYYRELPKQMTPADYEKYIPKK